MSSGMPRSQPIRRDDQQQLAGSGKDPRLKFVGFCWGFGLVLFTGPLHCLGAHVIWMGRTGQADAGWLVYFRLTPQVGRPSESVGEIEKN